MLFKINPYFIVALFNFAFILLVRASNGDKTVESETDVVMLTKAIFDESMTGVLENSSTTIIVSCKATGKPRPEIEFRLYDEYGPFMIRSGLFKVIHSTRCYCNCIISHSQSVNNFKLP
jgi:hypothetical protein